MAFAGTLNVSQNIYGNSSLNNCAVLSNSLAQSPSCFSDHPTHVRPRNPPDQDLYNPSRTTSVGSQRSSAATSNNYKRWCFVCEDPGEITTLDGFQRHMREHNTTYYCIPQDWVRNSENGPICAFCGIFNPDPSHLNKHNVPNCVGKTYTRKENLTEHLVKIHDIHLGSALADQSKYTVDQRYFACGFCVFCCDSLKELVNHVDARHYRFLEDIRDWDDAKVIRGLLSQPGVNDSWRGVLAATPHLQEWYLTWKHKDAKELRHRLEMSQEPAARLVKAVIDKSNYVTSQHGPVKSAPVTGSPDEEIATSCSGQTFQREDRLSLLPSTLEQDFLSYAPSVTAPTPQSQRLERDWDGLSNSGWDTSCEDWPSPQIETYGSPSSTVYRPAYHLARPYPSQEGADCSIQHQRPAFVSSNRSATYASHVMERQTRTSDYFTLSGYSPGVSHECAAHPESGQVTETHPYRAQAYASFFPPTLTNQSASSPLSPNRETSPLSHLNRAYSPHYPTVAAHFSHQETRDRHDMDMNLYSDTQQRSMRDPTVANAREGAIES